MTVCDVNLELLHSFFFLSKRKTFLRIKLMHNRVCSSENRNVAKALTRTDLQAVLFTLRRVCSGSHKQLTQTEWLQQQKFYNLTVLETGMSDLSASMTGFWWELSSWPADDCLLGVCSSGLFLGTSAWRESTSSMMSFDIRALILVSQGSTIMTAFNLSHLGLPGWH